MLVQVKDRGRGIRLKQPQMQETRSRVLELAFSACASASGSWEGRLEELNRPTGNNGDGRRAVCQEDTCREYCWRMITR